MWKTLQYWAAFTLGSSLLNRSASSVLSIRILGRASFPPCCPSLYDLSPPLDLSLLLFPILDSHSQIKSGSYYWEGGRIISVASDNWETVIISFSCTRPAPTYTLWLGQTGHRVSALLCMCCCVSAPTSDALLPPLNRRSSTNTRPQTNSCGHISCVHRPARSSVVSPRLPSSVLRCTVWVLPFCRKLGEENTPLPPPVLLGAS